MSLTNGQAWLNPRLAGRLPEFDGIRGLAVLAALAWHCFIFPARIPEGTTFWYATLPLQLMGTAIDLFFVLSGFLIGGILLDTKSAPGYFQAFYMRRLHRIVPPYFAWLLIYAIVLAAGAFPTLPAVHKVFAPVWSPWLSYPLFLQNIFAAAAHSFGPRWLAVFWSLGLEEQFYLAFPLLVWLLPRRFLVVALIAAAIIAPILRIHYSGNPFAQLMLVPCRADALALGALVALGARSQAAWTWLSAHAGLVVAVLLGSGLAVTATAWGSHLEVYPLMRPALVSSLAIFYSCALLLVLLVPKIGMPLGNRLLRHFGNWSFTIYITHQGLQYFLFALIFGTEPFLRGFGSFLVTFVVLALSIGIAAVSWSRFERPILKAGYLRFPYGTPTATTTTATTGAAPAVAQ
jgi:peptidoglycan/LPS O-acetylase OafA/YrhL